MTPPRWFQQWSIGIYSGPSPFRLTPIEGREEPVLTPERVTDIPASGLADPFLVRHEGTWHMFFEIVHQETGLGTIGWATSEDCLSWRYQQVVLREPFHLSHPHVIQDAGQFYMVPETRQAGRIQIYRADPFPHRWTPVQVLAEGPYADPTPFRHEGRWWMLVQRGLDELAGRLSRGALELADRLSLDMERRECLDLYRSLAPARPSG